MNTNTDIFSAAEAEVAALDAELERLSNLQRRRDALATWIADGRRLLASPLSEVKPDGGLGKLDTSPVATPDRTPRANTKKAIIADASAELIRLAGRPMPTRDIVAGLKARDIEIGGADEIDTVSVILNRSGGRFKSLGRKVGWVLTQEDAFGVQKEATPQVALTTAGS